MASAIQTNFRVRQSFGKISRIIDIPNLIDIQMKSYEKFLQAYVPPGERQDHGLQGVFRSVFPIRDFNGTSELVFVGYTLEKPKYDVDECRQRGMTFAAPIKVTIQLIIYDNSGEGSERLVDLARLRGEAGLKLLMMIPAGVPDLHDADATLDKATRDQELFALLTCPVRSAGVGGLLVDVECIERFGLHAERDLVAFETRLECGIPLQILSVDLV